MRALSRLETRLANFSKFEKRILFRLPVAGSLNEGHGNEGFGVIVSVDSEILLSGVGVFLPFGEENLSGSVPDRLTARVRLSEHAVSQIGPVGAVLRESFCRWTKKEIRVWNSEENCSRSKPRQSFKCMAGPWMSLDSRSRSVDLLDESECRSIHPYPIFFCQSAILVPGVRYLLSLVMVWEQDGEEVSRPVTTIWGFQVS